MFSAQIAQNHHGITGKSVISEGLQTAGTDKAIADGVSAVVDLASGGKGFVDDVAGAAKSLVTDSAGSTLSKTATAVGNTALTQANLDSNLGKIEIATTTVREVSSFAATEKVKLEMDIKDDKR